MSNEDTEKETINTGKLLTKVNGRDKNIVFPPERIRFGDKWIQHFSTGDPKRNTPCIPGYKIGTISRKGKFVPETTFIEYDRGFNFTLPKIIPLENNYYLVGVIASFVEPHPIFLLSGPRELSLTQQKDRLIQKPCTRYAYENKLATKRLILSDKEKILKGTNFRNKYFCFGLSLDGLYDTVVVKLGAGFTLFIDKPTKRFIVERRYKECNIDDRRTAPLPRDKGLLYCHVFVSDFSVEIFDDNLVNVMTYQFYPQSQESDLTLQCIGGRATLLLDVYKNPSATTTKME